MPNSYLAVNKDGNDVREDMETSAETVEMVPEINQDMEEERNPEELPKGKQLCSEKLATKIHEIILKTVIHQLHKILIQKVHMTSYSLYCIFRGSLAC